MGFQFIFWRPSGPRLNEGSRKAELSTTLPSEAAAQAGIPGRAWCHLQSSAKSQSSVN